MPGISNHYVRSIEITVTVLVKYYGYMYVMSGHMVHILIADWTIQMK